MSYTTLNVFSSIQNTLPPPRFTFPTVICGLHFFDGPFHFVNWMQNKFRLVYNRLLSATVSAAFQDISVTFLCCVSAYVSYRESPSMTLGGLSHHVLPGCWGCQPFSQVSHWIRWQDCKFMNCFQFLRKYLLHRNLMSMISKRFLLGNNLI